MASILNPSSPTGPAVGTVRRICHPLPWLSSTENEPSAAILIVRILVFAIMLFAAFPARAALAMSFQQTGQYNVEFVAKAGGNFPSVSGSFNLTQTVGPAVKAFLYAADFNNGSAPDLKFNSVPVSPTLVATDVELNGTMLGYKWDVTSMVTGSGSYSYTIGQNIAGSIISAVGLVVAYNDPLAVTRQITIQDGIEQVGVNPSAIDSKSFTFSGISAGSTDVWTFTGYDSVNLPNETGETVTWNGTNVGGPLDGALGFNASLAHGTATSLSGTNTMTVNTGPTLVDNFGVIAGVSMVTIPEPIHTTSTAVFAALALLLHRRRRTAD